jgi:hypothetical protein
VIADLTIDCLGTLCDRFGEDRSRVRITDARLLTAGDACIDCGPWPMKDCPVTS